MGRDARRVANDRCLPLAKVEAYNSRDAQPQERGVHDGHGQGKEQFAELARLEKQ